jgi:hypothetical protein
VLTLTNENEEKTARVLIIHHIFERNMYDNSPMYIYIIKNIPRVIPGPILIGEGKEGVDKGRVEEEWAGKGDN